MNGLGLLYHTTCEEDCTDVRVPQEEREDSTTLMCLLVLQSARDGLNALILKHPTQKSETKNYSLALLIRVTVQSSCSVSFLPT